MHFYKIDTNQCTKNLCANIFHKLRKFKFIIHVCCYRYRRVIMTTRNMSPNIDKSHKHKTNCDRVNKSYCDSEKKYTNYFHKILLHKISFLHIETDMNNYYLLTI